MLYKHDRNRHRILSIFFSIGMRVCERKSCLIGKFLHAELVEAAGKVDFEEMSMDLPDFLEKTPNAL